MVRLELPMETSIVSQRHGRNQLRDFVTLQSWVVDRAGAP